MGRLIVVLSLIATMRLAAGTWTTASADELPPGWERARGGANSHGQAVVERVGVPQLVVHPLDRLRGFAAHVRARAS
jgi:hypothetical protein